METETQTPEIVNLSLEKIIETKLVQNNITEQVLIALKENYGGMKLKSLEDKEGYLEIKAAKKEVAKVRTLTTNVCKKGREDALKIQKGWIAEEKRVLGRVAEVEDPLDAEIDRFDNEVDRKATEEKNRQEEAYINRQATLTRMGAIYSGGNFVLGEAEFEAILIKEASQDVWEEAVVPKFKAEYDKLEAVKVAEQKKKDAEVAEMKRQQDELRKEQEEFRQQQAEAQRQREESQRAERERIHNIEREEANKKAELQDKRLKILLPHNPYSQNIPMINTLWSISEEEFATIFSEVKIRNEQIQAEKQKQIEDAAIKREQERIAEEKRLEEIKKKQEEERKQAEMEAAKDKTKWEAFIQSVEKIEIYQMRSGQYRNKMAQAKEKIEEILSL